MIRSGYKRPKSNYYSPENKLKITDKDANKDLKNYQNRLKNKMDEFKESMQRQMQLQRHVLVEGLHRRVTSGSEIVP